MPSRKVIKAALEALAEATGGNSENGEGPTCGCKVPEHVNINIFCHCVTINNGACPEWGPFCSGENHNDEGGNNNNNNNDPQS